MGVAQLREVGLFGALSDEFLQHLASTLTVTRVTVGDTIFREGDPAREMYAVLDGEIEVLKKSRRGRETRVAILGPNVNSYRRLAFGEVSPKIVHWGYDNRTCGLRVPLDTLKNTRV